MTRFDSQDPRHAEAKALLAEEAGSRYPTEHTDFENVPLSAQERQLLREALATYHAQLKAHADRQGPLADTAARARVEDADALYDKLAEEYGR